MRHRLFPGIAVMFVLALFVLTRSVPMPRSSRPRSPKPAVAFPPGSGAGACIVIRLMDDGRGRPMAFEIPGEWIPTDDRDMSSLEGVGIVAVRFFPDGTIVVTYDASYPDGTPVSRSFRFPTDDDVT